MGGRAEDTGPDPASAGAASSGHLRVVLEAVAVVVLALAAHVVAARYDLFERLLEATRGLEPYNVDEAPFGLFVLALALACFAYRRWREYAGELTIRREVEARAALAHERLIDAVESIPASFMLFGADDRLVLCNSKSRELFPELASRLAPGVSFEALCRETLDRGLAPEASSGGEGWLARRRALHREPRGPVEERRPDGRWLQVFERRTADGGTVGICTDITELKSHEAGLRQAQKIEALGRLTGGIAHDFSNLLTIILGNLQMIEDGDPAAEGAGELVREAAAAAERGTELTGRLLAFARRQPMHPRPVDLRETVGGMADLLRRTLGDPIEIEVRLADDLGFAVADPSLVENAILNLALNARDAMPNGGRLVIEAANVALGADSAEAGPEARPGEYVLLAMADTGTGMVPEVKERAFDPFFTTKPEGKGTGLGLSMVYGFVRQSGGHAAIDSEPGRGTAVRLYLPRSEAPPAEDGAAAAAEGDAPLEGRVLLVEDDPGVRRFAARLLGGLGLRVEEAETGRQALALLDRTASVDLLVTDVMMPGGVSGFDLAEAARRRHPGLRVVLASSADDPRGRSAALSQNVELVRKPYGGDDLARAVRRLMGGPTD